MDLRTQLRTLISTRFVRKLETTLFVAGVVLLAAYVSALIHGNLLSRIELQQFMQARNAARTAPKSSLGSNSDAPDFTLWSKTRIAAYTQSLSTRIDSPMAVLQITKINLTVPLLEGTDDLTLNRGVGHITGTAFPGKDGNVGIAGHRDGFFRGLKEIELGDRISLLLPDGAAEYVVDQISIVDPSDVSVLRPGPDPALTLVTCYPFYCIGSAPQRYIVHAAIASRDSIVKSETK